MNTTLYERLKTEHKISLLLHEKKFPYITGEMIEELKNKCYIHRMSYGLWIDLKAICRSHGWAENPYELFDEEEEK